MQLLEREKFFDHLAARLNPIAEGNGHIALICGEAGIGKTSLVQSFTEQQEVARVLWGACEALFTPRPLGPLHDIAHQIRTPLRHLLDTEASRPAIFSAFLDELKTSKQPTIIVFDDVHWADEATLDLIKFLGRRLQHLPALLLLTYRDDELGAQHPLRFVIGDFPGKTVTRLQLPPLSEAAVTALAQKAGRSAAGLYSATGGNPFFVTEVLTSHGDGVPATVQDAMRYLSDGIAYCLEHDLDAWSLYMMGWRARRQFDQGHWDDATEDAHAVLKRPQLSAMIKIPALVILARVRVRRGDPEAASVLEEARDLAMSTGELQRIAPAVAARAEAAWLKGELEQCVAETRVGYELALQHQNAWELGELSFWMWRAGGLTEAPFGIAAPYALQLSGNWRAAAEQWKKVGCPYEQALALMDGDESALREALAIFEQLGAVPAAEIVRWQLRRRGVRNVPRGPRSTTKENPAGLTNRQMEILALIVAGLQNAEIARRLFISPKTVDHHISAVLAKLNVHSRTEAAGVAHQLGILSQSQE